MCLINTWMNNSLIDLFIRWSLEEWHIGQMCFKKLRKECITEHSPTGECHVPAEEGQECDTKEQDLQKQLGQIIGKNFLQGSQPETNLKWTDYHFPTGRSVLCFPSTALTMSPYPGLCTKRTTLKGNRFYLFSVSALTLLALSGLFKIHRNTLQKADKYRNQSLSRYTTKLLG